MKKGSQVTLDTIAQRMKISKVTVSKALRGYPDISPVTAKKIRALARELGYLPNYMARNLSSEHTRMIGVVVPKLAHFFFSSVIEAIYETALAHKYEIILTVSQEDAERELRHMQTLLSMRVDGIIISVSQQTKDYSIFERVREMGIPLTFMDRSINMEGYNTVVADDFAGAYAAIRQAINVGYRKIAHFGGFSHTYIGKQRRLGFETAMKEHGIPLRPEWSIEGGFGENDGFQGFMKLYEANMMPECIFAVTFPVALGIYRAAEQVGMKIPADIDLIAFGNSGFNQFLSPPMSYIEQPTTEMGKQVVELTINSIQERDEFVPRTIVLPTKLVLCSTCMAPTATHGDLS